MAAGWELAAGPEGGARFIAGPDGASGTKAGGTGGGRSLNIWATAGAVIPEANTAANANVASRRPRCPVRPIPSSPEAMGMLFTENAANSSLRDTDRGPWNRRRGRRVTILEVAIPYNP